MFVDLAKLEYGFISSDLKVLVQGNDVYLNYNTIKIKTNIKEFSNLLGLGQSTNLTSIIDTNQIMDELNKASITKDGSNVSMLANLTLLGQSVPVTFNFVEEGENITLKDVSANLSFNDLIIGINEELIVFILLYLLGL